MRPASRFMLFVALGSVLVAGGAALAADDGDGDGIPDQAEVLLKTDPMVADTDGDGKSDKEDDKPLAMANPITREGTADGLAFKSGKVEDNFDPAINKDAADHLELEIQNIGSAPVQGADFFITIADDTTGETETYYRPLKGVAIPSGETRIIHFDEGGSPDFTAAADHFRSNPHSILYTNPNAKTVTVEMAAAGSAPVTITIAKDAGVEEND